MELIQNTLSRLAVVDLLALAWLLAGVALGLVRGLPSLFGWLLWIVTSLWLARTVTPVVLGWLSNTEGTDSPFAQLLAYGVLTLLALGLPLLGRALSGPGGPKRAPPGNGERGLAVVAGAASALITFTLLLPYLGRWELLGRSYPTAVAPHAGARVQDVLWWLYPRAHLDSLDALRTPPVDEPAETGTPSFEPMPR